MVRYWSGWFVSCAALVGSISTASDAQVAPESPVHVAVNGVFFLCPRLVHDDGAFPSSELGALGFAPSDEKGRGKSLFRAIGDRGLMLVSYDTGTKRCILDYTGPGYQAIAGVVRDTATKNGFKRLTGGDKDGAKADVLEGAARGSDKTARIIVIEKYSQPSASISFAER